jgi:hypothetical protein
MKWIRERYEVIKEAAGIRWYVFGLLVTIAVVRIDNIYKWFIKSFNIQLEGDPMMFGFPSWILGFSVALLFLFWWVLEYAVELRRQIKVSRLELAKLRKLGVEIRNDGLQLTDEASWIKWEKEATKWSGNVYGALKKVSEADAEIFNVLDVVPAEPRLPYIPLNRDHAKLLREHDCRLDRLSQMVYSLWRT